MRRLFVTLAIAIVIVVMLLAAAIVHVEPAVVVASCWPNNATLAVAVASASVGCCLGVVTGLFAVGAPKGGPHFRSKTHTRLPRRGGVTPPKSVG